MYEKDQIFHPAEERGDLLVDEISELSAGKRSSRPPSVLPPCVRSDSKPEPSDYPALGAFDIKVDGKSKFPVLLLAIATIC